MTLGLFDAFPSVLPPRAALAEGAVLLRRFACDIEDRLARVIESIAAAAPFRHMVTPGGYRMSVAMTNCGHVGWVSNASGYRYDAVDPETGRAWPPLPDTFLDLAARAAKEAGFDGFVPDSALINRYEPGARLSLHQDRNERDLTAPIVSVSLGLPATFLFGGAERSEAPRRIRVEHGDVAIWGGAARLTFHGVAPLEDGQHPIFGRHRINLTFRQAR
ncbi:MAG TPA: DNA oxidative demethylase AlkB [Polyangiaceae bacterium]|nr:DNA oxidative demethylase AlkB [Polyangiaceae bacterium]